MNGHANLFDAAAAAEARDKGIGLVEAHHGAQVERILGLIGILALGQSEITCDDVHKLMAERGVTEPAQPNAWGAAFRKAALQGLIEDSGRAVKSARPEAHARRIPVWRSCITQEQKEIA